MHFDFANVLVFSVAAGLFVVVNLLVGRLLLRPRTTLGPRRQEIYECGEPTIGSAWIRFDIRFYTVALMFVVFDVEVALLFPWGAVFRELAESGAGWLAFVEAATFLVILAAGLAYVWARGDIDWTPAPGTLPRTSEDAPSSSGPTSGGEARTVVGAGTSTVGRGQARD